MARRREQFICSESEKKKAGYVYSPTQLEQQLADINVFLASPPKCSRGQCSYTTKHAYGVIQNQIKSLHSKGYRFKADSNKKPFYDNQDSSYVHEIKRVLKLRFKCKNNRCPQFKVTNEQVSGRKWTTYYGLTQCSIYFDEDDVMRYQFKVYGQKCLTCKIWGSGSVIESEMRELARLYGIVIETIIQEAVTLKSGIPLKNAQKNGRPPTKRGGGIKMVGRALMHRDDLCQACLYGKCLNFYKPKIENSRKSSRN